jgi:REP element-mobilizing transposase RayT
MKDMKSFTSHEANKILGRRGQFWMEEYFDRYIRDAKHFSNAIAYIENNPVKAGLCARPEEWPFSSAWWRVRRP